jgi:hypothetical protein
MPAPESVIPQMISESNIEAMRRWGERPAARRPAAPTFTPEMADEPISLPSDIQQRMVEGALRDMEEELFARGSGGFPVPELTEPLPTEDEVFRFADPTFIGRTYDASNPDDMAQAIADGIIPPLEELEDDEDEQST